MTFLTGLVGAIVAGVFWGSNFIVTKRYDMGDGLHFQLFLCLGIGIIGILTLPFHESMNHDHVPNYDAFPLPDVHVTFSTAGLLGGSLWCVANLLTVPIVDSIGIGVGMSFWSGTALVTSFVVGRTSVFGLVPTPLRSNLLAMVGILFAVASLLCFAQIKSKAPSSDTNDGDLEEMYPLSGEAETGDHHGQEHPRSGKDQKRRGLIMCVVAGTLYGIQFLPFAVHNVQHPKPDGVSSLVHQVRFFFSQFLGTMLTSVVCFVVYVARSNNKPRVISPNAIVPSIVSGMMWATAAMGSMVATGELGLSVGFPLSSNGAFLMNAFWALVVFKEIQDKQDKQWFYLAGGLSVASSILLSVAS